MFAKLKKKIAEEEGVDEGELTAKVTPGGAQRKSSRENARRAGETSPASLSPWGSTSSLASSVSATPTSAKKDSADSGRKDVLGNKDEQIKKLEEKLDEYSLLLKEAVKAKEKMENSVISHEEATSKKIQDINEQYQLRRSKMAEKLSSAVKKKEDEMTEKMQEVEKENSSLQERLQRLERTRFKKEEEQEDFQGFQVQELAKVKHMLLNSQESLQKCRADLEQSRERLEEKSNLSEELSRTVQTLKDEKAEVSNSRDQLQKSKDAMQETLTRMEKEALIMEERCQTLTKEKQERESQILSLEKKAATTQEELDAHKYSEQSSKSQVKKDFDEKDRTITRLQDKLSVLEQRLQDTSLSEDEKVTAVKSERDLLEKKLEEVRNQLSELKIQSSEQISSLEKQISHLNAKILEDQDDQKETKKDLEASTVRYQKEMEKMEARIKELEEEKGIHLEKLKKQSTDLVLQKSASETEMSNAHRSFDQSKKLIMEQKQQLQEKVAGFEAKIIQLETARDFDKSASEHKIGRLQSVNEEYLEKEIEHERQVTQLEEEKEKLQALCHSLNSGEYLEHEKSLSVEISKLSELKEALERQAGQLAKEKLETEGQLRDVKEDVKALQQKLAESESIAERLSEEKKMIEQDLSDKESKHKSQSQDYTSMVSKLTDKQIEIDDLQKQHSADLAEIQRTLSEKDGALGILRESISQKESLCKEHEEKIKQLEKGLEDQHSELESHQQGSQQIHQQNQQLTDSMGDLEQELTEKNKTIKMQQQRLSDLKKTLSRELKVQANIGNDSSEETSRANDVHESIAPPPVSMEMPPASLSTISLNNFHENNAMDYREINFRYLRHVVFKFMSGTDIECIQLLKAVSVVLEFTQQEQKIIRETLEWKNSWFGARPRRRNWDIKLPSRNPHIR